MKAKEEKTRAIRTEIEVRMAVAVTESLPNLKIGSAAKRGAALEASTHAASKVFGLRKPCVLMKRTD